MRYAAQKPYTMLLEDYTKLCGLASTLAVCCRKACMTGHHSRMNPAPEKP